MYTLNGRSDLSLDLCFFQFHLINSSNVSWSKICKLRNCLDMNLIGAISKLYRFAFGRKEGREERQGIALEGNLYEKLWLIFLDLWWQFWWSQKNVEEIFDGCKWVSYGCVSDVKKKVNNTCWIHYKIWYPTVTHCLCWIHVSHEKSGLPSLET